MTSLHSTTVSRLQRIPQIHSVWEGDRRPIGDLGSAIDADEDRDGECVIWVDGSEGMVRAIDAIEPDSGHEAVVRTLLRAIENPHSNARPARPRKIVVRDREVQFFLRGALQSLGIIVDYAPHLPLIDDLFRGFQENSFARPPHLPTRFAELLPQAARELWQTPPWHFLTDSDILAIDVKQPGIETLYACVMGMLGQEFGVLLYRSLNSLRQFRMAVAEQGSIEHLERAFLHQDCWFLNFEPPEDEEDASGHFTLDELPDHMEPCFGSVHPYEGMRPFLSEEEALPVFLALKALQRFVVQSRQQLVEDPIPAIARRHQIPVPQPDGSEQRLLVTVQTLPDLAAEFAEWLDCGSSDLLDDGENEASECTYFPLHDDLIPEDSYLSIGMVAWELIEMMRASRGRYYQSRDVGAAGEGMPVVLIQTSRPKAKVLIERLQAAGGLDGIGFNPGEVPSSEMVFDLGILRTGDGNLFLFGEFDSDDPTHRQARLHWERRSRKVKGFCALIVASGLTGAARGQPGLREMMAVFEAKALSDRDFGIGVLRTIS
ncbi:hypothetical protein KR51_00014100 [Rubidibacter lacunae KORDI 51-2]|uniref:Uncharacterized protein n=1 Tax=Rubidibacter lacunae KORDI 51-2 TaxID=582515 RepID=U5DK63_9CHRO|nr:hypothetical protein [Rubidibacter lacunae]ERN42071.1 hypothetical protein KR51_00014100 [Rubidibacter lacunae KORDI 51-2]